MALKPITIDWKNFIQGESSADYVPDRGFSPASYQLNLTKTRGMVHWQESPTDLGGATLTGNILAATHDPRALGNDAYYLDNEAAFYYLSGATLTKAQTAGGSSGYTLGTSEILVFKDETFATTDYEVIKLTGGNLTAIDSYWWTVTQGRASLTTSCRHPLEKVEDKMYIGDKNNIHTWDGTTSQVNAIVLPTDVNITSLRKHTDGRNLVAFCGLRTNFTHTSGAGGRIYLIDTNTSRWIREIDTETQVEGSRNVGGIIYTTFGKNVGYFNGDGITPIKRLETSGTTYSHNLGNIEDILILRDGLDVLAYGDLGAGKVWWKPYRNITNTNAINNILYKGDNVLTVSFSDSAGGGKLQQVDFDNAGQFGQLVSNRINFGGEVSIRKIVCLHDQVSAGTRFGVYYRDTENVDTLIEDKIYSSTITYTATKTRIDCDVRTDMFQLVLVPVVGSIGFKSITIYYESTE